MSVTGQVTMAGHPPTHFACLMDRDGTMPELVP